MPASRAGQRNSDGLGFVRVLRMPMVLEGVDTARSESAGAEVAQLAPVGCTGEALSIDGEGGQRKGQRHDE